MPSLPLSYPHFRPYDYNVFGPQCLQNTCIQLYEKFDRILLRETLTPSGVGLVVLESSNQHMTVRALKLAISINLLIGVTQIQISTHPNHYIWLEVQYGFF